LTNVLYWKDNYLKHTFKVFDKETLYVYAQNSMMGGTMLTESRSIKPQRYGEGIVAAVSVGGFFVLLGVIFAIIPNLFERIVAFFTNFGVVEVTNTGIFLPAPTTPWAHSVVYTAASQFSLGIGILQILIVALRLAIRSPLGKTAEAISNLVFWFGASYLIPMFLNEATSLKIWFTFWTAMIVLIGVSLIVRAIVLMLRR
jgi:hypothetical protein